MTALRDLQAAFLSDIYSHGQSSAGYLAAPHYAARLSIYANNTALALQGYLEARYPVVRQVIGAPLFQALSRRYCASHPLASGNVFNYGAGFAETLRVAPELAKLRYVTELATLEWALHHAEVAADADPLPSEALLTASLALHPAVTCLELQFNTVALWQAHQCEPFTGFTLEARPSVWIIGRTAAHAVFCESLDATTAHVLNAAPAAGMAEALSSADASMDALQASLAFILSRNLLIQKESS